MFIVSFQDKGVSIIIIGIITNWKKKSYIKKSTRRMAGKKGKVLMYQDFDELSRKFGDVLAAACRKLVFLFFLPQLLVTEHIKCNIKKLAFSTKDPSEVMMNTTLFTDGGKYCFPLPTGSHGDPL